VIKSGSDTARREGDRETERKGEELHSAERDREGWREGERDKGHATISGNENLECGVATLATPSEDSPCCFAREKRHEQHGVGWATKKKDAQSESE